MTHRWPQILPGGTAVLFTENSSLTDFSAANIDVVTLRDGKRKTLVHGGTFGRFLYVDGKPGYLAFIRNSTLYTVAFDRDSLQTRGTPVPVLEHVGYNWNSGSAQFDFSQTGTLVYRSGMADITDLDIVQWMNRDGNTQPLLTKPGRYFYPHLSPDNQRLAVEIADKGSRDIWIYDWKRDLMTRLTFDAAGSANMNPLWSPDGRHIIFAGKGGMYSILTNGAGKPQRLTESETPQLPYSITRNGRRLALMEQLVGGGISVWTMAIQFSGSGVLGGKPEAYLQTSFDVRYPALSPDGNWLAYTSNESGIYEVYVRAFPNPGGKWQISSGGGAYPVWSPNGRELLFRSLDSRFMVVSYAPEGESFVADKPRLWSERRVLDSVVGQGAFDLASDRRRVIMLAPVETERRTAKNDAIFLENFLDEVRRVIDHLKSSFSELPPV